MSDDAKCYGTSQQFAATLRRSAPRSSVWSNSTARDSKKVENLPHAVSLHDVHYDFAAATRRSACFPRRPTGVADHEWTLRAIAALLN